MTVIKGIPLLIPLDYSIDTELIKKDYYNVIDKTTFKEHSSFKVTSLRHIAALLTKSMRSDNC
jgi:hypothetical protein